MSNALALAGVTAVLRDLLNDGMVNHNVSGVLGSTVVVSAVPPDRVVNGGENAQINLFLHRVTPNTGWRNEGLPSRDSAGRNRLTNPPLALDLHYLLSAYSSGDLLHGEILLGYAMQLLHETPVLTRDAIRTALTPSPTLPPALADSGLDRQIEQIRIVPEYLNTEEISKLWTATLSHYRPTAAYQVSVVLIESTQPARSPLPVLTRGRRIPGLVPGTERDEGVFVAPDMVPPYPTLESALVAAHETPSTLQLGDVVTVRGHHLAGTGRSVVLRNDTFKVAQEIALADSIDETTFDFNVPNLPVDLPVGLYRLELHVLRPGDPVARFSNALPVALAPALIFPPALIARSVANVLSLHIGCQPEVRVGQKVTLLMDTREAPALPFTANPPTLRFEFADAPPAGGTPLLRLKVDGIESIVVNRGARPPAFFDHHITLPA